MSKVSRLAGDGLEGGATEGDREGKMADMARGSDGLAGHGPAGSLHKGIGHARYCSACASSMASRISNSIGRTYRLMRAWVVGVTRILSTEK